MRPLIDFLRKVLFTSPKSSSGLMPIYVRCDSCGEALVTEINLQNDLSVDYGSSSKRDRYHVHKTITGSNLCFQRIEVELEFDARKRLISKKISGGTRIDEEEFQRLTQSMPDSS